MRTPGFWQSKFGSQFWDGTVGNEAKAGQDGFADGELLYAVDSNGDGFINGSDQVGLLIGDYDGDGLSAGEDTIFISLSDARKLISANEKQSQDARYVLGRDTVATWLNALAGNNIGDGSDAGSPAAWLDDAIDWLQLYADKSPTDGRLDLSAANAVRASSSAWQTGGSGVVAGSAIHGALDEYNNSGSIDGTAFAHDSDDSMFIAALGVERAGGTDLMMLM